MGIGRFLLISGLNSSKRKSVKLKSNLNLHWVSLGVRQSSMKVFLLTAVSVLTTAYGMEWSFEGANPLRSDDGGATLTGSVSVKKNAGISGNALYFDGKKDFLELRLTESNRPRREMTISYWLKPDLGCTLFPIVRAPSRDVEFSGNSGYTAARRNPASCSGEVTSTASIRSSFRSVFSAGSPERSATGSGSSTGSGFA